MKTTFRINVHQICLQMSVSSDNGYPSLVKDHYLDENMAVKV